LNAMTMGSATTVLSRPVQLTGVQVADVPTAPVLQHLRLVGASVF